MSEYNNLKSILSKAQKFIVDTTPNTIFDVIGHGHYENINSNILAYYLSSENQHNLYPYFIETIFELLDIKNCEYSDVTVHREYQTLKSGRIDIVIETDNIVIGIENKIFHTIDNDFKDYKNTLQSTSIKKREPILCLLTLNKEKHDQIDKNITHIELWQKVFEKINFSQYLLDKNLIILNDVTMNIENLTKGSKMRDEQIEFLQDNSSEIKHIFNLVLQFENRQKKAINEIRSYLNPDDGNKLFTNFGIARVANNKEYFIKDFILWCELDYDAIKIIIDIKTDIKDEWKVFAYHHNGRNRNFTPELEAILKDKKIDFVEQAYDGVNRAKLIKSIENQSIHAFVIEIAKKIRQHS